MVTMDYPNPDHESCLLKSNFNIVVKKIYQIVFFNWELLRPPLIPEYNLLLIMDSNRLHSSKDVTFKNSSKQRETVKNFINNYFND